MVDGDFVNDGFQYFFWYCSDYICFDVIWVDVVDGDVFKCVFLGECFGKVNYIGFGCGVVGLVYLVFLVVDGGDVDDLV